MKHLERLLVGILALLQVSIVAIAGLAVLSIGYAAVKFFPRVSAGFVAVLLAAYILGTILDSGGWYE